MLIFLLHLWKRIQTGHPKSVCSPSCSPSWGTAVGPKYYVPNISMHLRRPWGTRPSASELESHATGNFFCELTGQASNVKRPRWTSETPEFAIVGMVPKKRNHSSRKGHIIQAEPTRVIISELWSHYTVTWLHPWSFRNKNCRTSTLLHFGSVTILPNHQHWICVSFGKFQWLATCLCKAADHDSQIRVLW